jgi:transcriptional regulator with XRE-family HTH domain
MAALMREVIGDVLRRARTSQGRTLREVSDSARVSLGYLSEVERGRKEASSELLTAICGALDIPLSEVLTGAGYRLARKEQATSAQERATAAADGQNAHASASSETSDAASAANIDATTKVIIPPVVSLAVA